VSWITRTALFALPVSNCPLTNEQLKYVAKRADKALSNHLEDSNDEFRSWLDDDKSDLPKFIERPLDSLVTRKEARLGLLELSWESFHAVGQCVDAQMRAFRDALPEPLAKKSAWYSTAFSWQIRLWQVFLLLCFMSD
jgi:hypothetical protein